MPSQLSEGAIEAISMGKDAGKPVLQILGSKKIPSNNADRYRVIVSDGLHSHAFAMLGSQLNPMMVNKELENFTVIRVEKFVSNKVGESMDKNILILLELTVVQTADEVGGRIGNPVLFNASSASTNVAASNGRDEHVPSSTTSSNARSVPAKSPLPAPLGTNNSYGGRNASSGSTFSSNRTPFSSGGGGGSSSSSFSATSISPSKKLYPISSLTPYQNRWVVKGRITNKSAIKTWNNSRGSGKLFSFELLDDSGAIRATAFNDECEKYHEMLELDKVYFVSNANLKEANKKFSSLKNDYEMSLRKDTVIELCTDDCSAVPEIQFEFIPISQLAQMEKDSCADVIGVCKACSTVQTIVARQTQRELKKREVQIVDDTNTEITITLWAEEAEKFDGDNHPVVAVRGARISDFGGAVSLSTVMQSTVYVNPQIERAYVLQGWYEREGKQGTIVSLSARGPRADGDIKWVHEIVNADLGKGEKPDYVTCYAIVAEISKSNSVYKACSSDGCNKKLINIDGGLYRCEKCNLESPDFKWRFLLNIDLCDHAESLTAVCFHEAAEIITGRTAEELGSLMSEDPKRYERALASCAFKEFKFTLRVKMESFNDEYRMKITVASVTPANNDEQIGFLTKCINNL